MKIAIFVLIGLVIIAGIIGFFFYLSRAQHDVVDITVKSKERIAEANDGKYLIFTKDEVYENTDSLFYWKFNSSDVYNKLEVGETYSCEVFNFRLEFLSMYKNIIRCNY